MAKSFNSIVTRMSILDSENHTKTIPVEVRYTNTDVFEVLDVRMNGYSKIDGVLHTPGKSISSDFIDHYCVDYKNYSCFCEDIKQLSKI